MATLDDIVSAAAKVFRTKGYHAATVRDIADEVGILKGSLYHHFDSKEDLLYLVVKEPIAQMFRTISEIAAADGTATEKLRWAISAHLEAFDRHYPHLFVYLRERESVKRRFREMIGFSPKEYERCWQQIIREGADITTGSRERHPRCRSVFSALVEHLRQPVGQDVGPIGERARKSASDAVVVEQPEAVADRDAELVAIDSSQ